MQQVLCTGVTLSDSSNRMPSDHAGLTTEIEVLSNDNDRNVYSTDLSKRIVDQFNKEHDAE